MPAAARPEPESLEGVASKARRPIGGVAEIEAGERTAAAHVGRDAALGGRVGHLAIATLVGEPLTQMRA